MSEEEKIIENVKQTIEEYEEVIQEEQEKGNVEDVESEIETKQAIQGLLDLYTKQKQTIDKLQKENALYKKIHGNLATEVNRKLYTSNYISKNKIRNKIKELEEIEKQFEFIDNDSYARKRNKDFIIMLKGLLEE